MTPNRQPLHIKQVTITLAGETLLAMHRDIAPGEVLTVMGPSGSGKSTCWPIWQAFIAGLSGSR